MEETMRTETDEIRDNLKYLTLLSRDYPSQAAAASEIISTQALLKLPKGTEHFMSDLHGENEAFVHILNSASGVIREKVDQVLGEAVPEHTRAELATLIYYPNEKLPQLKARCADEEALDQWYTETLLRLIDICRLVSSKHTREHVRKCLPASCGYILDELLHAHFEDHDKDLYYGQIVGSIIENGRADRFIVRLCELIKHLAVDKLHIVGDLFDRGPRPDIILDLLMRHHNVDIQWGNHDVVWMGAAAGSPICICTVLKTTLAYHNHGMIEDCYGINLRHLQRMAEQYYGEDDLSIWMPHTDAARGPYTKGMLHRCAVMHKAISILMFKLECPGHRPQPGLPDAGPGLSASHRLVEAYSQDRGKGVSAAGYLVPHRRPCRPGGAERGRAAGAAQTGELFPPERKAAAACGVPVRQGQRVPH